jgi:putative membrane protein
MTPVLESVKRRPRLVIAILIIIYIVGLFGLSVDTTRELFMSLTPVTLLFSFGLLLLFNESFDASFWIPVVFIFLAGFFVEVAGVSTGLIFGGYEYGSSLGLKLFHTPLMIGINWVMLTYCIWVLLGGLNMNGFLKSLLGAMMMVIYDFNLEPMAIKFDMWSWEGGDVPIQNYIAWFVISFIFFGLLSIFGVRFRNRLALAIIGVQFVFFLVLNLLDLLGI